MQYQFFTADVFTDRIFGGNPLAVFPQAEGIPTELMQKIAAEFNYSETVFVFPPETPQGTRRIRIFTPQTELPFAGHPTVGTAYILAAIGELVLDCHETMIYLEEGVGLVPVKIKSQDGVPIYSELTASQIPQVGPEVPSIAKLAEMLSLEVDDLLDNEYYPQAFSCGVPFLFIPLRNRDAIERVKLNLEQWQNLLSNAWASAVYVFCFEPELKGSDVRSRMFAPNMGIVEDPATGSAAAAIAGYLAMRDTSSDQTLAWVIEQGFEMGRPSILKIEADQQDNQIIAVRVGGSSVLVSEGTMNIPEL
ncbi:PhzF family phenazine biosynthesis protein [Chroococcus sp. FPU101]|uniref:PhzF family phenazine biosynthesis protein n=1 Tax=Chroococcus sp. FPU101 TaxID=1974212 RepID=UPI001A8C99DF|nr:PhzF family phenazine biosynthesis protein [Chroococcus sp. FPU101]GFE70339.1 phenazine biosynthesis protein PhzF family [Chroococcus sp. FPU101]